MLWGWESNSHVSLPCRAVWPLLLSLLILLQRFVLVLHLLLPTLLQVERPSLLLDLQLWLQAGCLALPLGCRAC